MKDFVIGIVSLLVTVAALVGFCLVMGLVLGAARGPRGGSNPPPPPDGRRPAAPPPPPHPGWVGGNRIRDPDQVQTQPRMPAAPREPGGESWD